MCEAGCVQIARYRMSCDPVGTPPIYLREKSTYPKGRDGPKDQLLYAEKPTILVKRTACAGVAEVDES